MSMRYKLERLDTEQKKQEFIHKNIGQHYKLLNKHQAELENKSTVLFAWYTGGELVKITKREEVVRCLENGRHLRFPPIENAKLSIDGKIIFSPEYEDIENEIMSLVVKEAEQDFVVFVYTGMSYQFYCKNKQVNRQINGDMMPASLDDDTVNRIINTLREVADKNGLVYYNEGAGCNAVAIFISKNLEKVIANIFSTFDGLDTQYTADPETLENEMHINNAYSPSMAQTLGISKAGDMKKIIYSQQLRRWTKAQAYHDEERYTLWVNKKAEQYEAEFIKAHPALYIKEMADILNDDVETIRKAYGLYTMEVGDVSKQLIKDMVRYAKENYRDFTIAKDSQKFYVADNPKEYMALAGLAVSQLEKYDGHGGVKVEEFGGITVKVPDMNAEVVINGFSACLRLY